MCRISSFNCSPKGLLAIRFETREQSQGLLRLPPPPRLAKRRQITSRHRHGVFPIRKHVNTRWHRDNQPPFLLSVSSASTCGAGGCPPALPPVFILVSCTLINTVVGFCGGASHASLPGPCIAHLHKLHLFATTRLARSFLRVVQSSLARAKYNILRTN